MATNHDTAPGFASDGTLLRAPWSVQAAVVVAVCLVVREGLLLGAWCLGGRSAKPGLWLVALGLFTLHGVGTAAILWVLVRRCPRPTWWRELQLDRLTRWDLAWIGGLAVVFVCFMLGLMVIANYGFTVLGWPPSQDPVLDLIRRAGLPVRLALSVTMVTLVPVAEELIFRQVFYRAVAFRLGARWALIVVSLLFGAVHGTPYATVVLFGFALILQTIKERTGNLWYPILLHAAFNGAVLALTPGPRPGPP